MRTRGWMLPTMLLLALAPGAARAAGTDRTDWHLSSFTWVKRVAAEAGAPANTHPITLSPDALQAALGSVQTKDEGKDVPLFGKDELKDLSKALSEAFALAQPGQDLVLLTTSRHGASFLERATGLTARLFVRDGALNLLVHDDRLDFLDRYLVDNIQPTFTYGSRKTASTQQLQAPGATRLRGDWLALPLAAPAPAPVAAVAPVPAAAPKAAPGPAPAAHDAAFYEAQTERLKALKRLRDEDLLSEAEYQERREAILKTL
jgi:hypothetical protein